MSDNETTQKTGVVGNGMAWTENQVLVYLFAAMDHQNFKIDFQTAPLPPGRTTLACSKKINKLKIALKPEIEALKAGVVLPATPDTTPKGRGRKRKVVDAAQDKTPTKKGKAKAKAGAKEDTAKGDVTKGNEDGEVDEEES